MTQSPEGCETSSLKLRLESNTGQLITMQNLGGEENANTLTFGSEFENVSCLSNAEVSIVLEKQKDSYAAKDLNVTP